ncbi:hypothetical protein EVAR_863_1 [Eumeta japonica]|uniref:Uncharacterized protein n=1 Tax=Eumeta variegata TaxID=151549 RepID=A0A4C1SGF2_EUMVA|nr:hypothetical protein EVAR_863_1 [Eumeta japonica]
MRSSKSSGILMKSGKLSLEGLAVSNAVSGSRVALVAEEDGRCCCGTGMTLGGLGGALLQAAKLTRYWLCQPTDGLTGKGEEEEGACAAVGSEGLYPRDHAPAHPPHADHDHDDRGYMEGNRYVAHRHLPGLNHSNSSCSSASNASGTGAPLGCGDPPPPLYIAAPPDGFGLAVHNTNRRGTDVSIIGATGITQKEPNLPQKRGKLSRGYVTPKIIRHARYAPCRQGPTASAI